MPAKPCILFTAFEPSGDEHAAPVIRELRSRLPDTPIYALGGPKMQAAGANLIERTTERSAMLAGSVGKIREQLALRKRFGAWLADRTVAVHVPTDSPAANWWFCKTIKRTVRNVKVVHLVAPQVWAWASWRVGRLKKWSDLVLCLLPFEPAWFEKHGVAARFIGHPLFESVAPQATQPLTPLPTGHTKLALLPGSRPGEIEANWPIMAEAALRMSRRCDDLAVVAAAADRQTQLRIGQLTPELPPALSVVVESMDTVLEWSDVVLTASGTATLHVARHAKPMAVLYRVHPLSWHLIGRWLVNTRTFTLPNLIAAGGPSRNPDGHIVKEFVPFLGGARRVRPIADELASLVEDSKKRDFQIKGLQDVGRAFSGHQAGQEAAHAIAEFATMPP